MNRSYEVTDYASSVAAQSGTGNMGSHNLKFAFAAGLLVLASAVDAKPKKAPPPPPPPPPPPVVVYIPPRPTPPLGASPLSVIPPLGLNGLRQTINTGVSPIQAVWNLRSAYNVAALNCQRPEHAEILSGYKLFLKQNKLGLAKANRGVDAEFRKRSGAAFVRPREAYMTKVYNFYAFPPTLSRFCDAALLVARESLTVKPLGLTAFAQRSLVTLDQVFENFYRSFEQYRVDAAAWDAKYAPTPVAPPAQAATAMPVGAVAPAGKIGPAAPTSTLKAPGT